MAYPSAFLPGVPASIPVEFYVQAALAYRVGKVDMLTLIDNWNQLLRFQIQLKRLEATLGQILASLERAVGAELARPTTDQLPPARPVK